MIHQRLSTILLFLSLASISLSFDTLYGTISAQDAMTWIQQNQPAADGSDATVRWFWNQNDARMHPARKAAANPATDIDTPWLDPVRAGQSILFTLGLFGLWADGRGWIGSCKVAAVNLGPVGVQTTWTQVKMAVLSVLAGGVDPNAEATVLGGIVYLGKIFN